MRIGNLEIIFLNFLVSRLTGNLIWCILHVSLLLFQILQGEKMSKLTPVFRHSQLLMNRIVKLQPMQTSRAYYRIDDEIRKINKTNANFRVTTADLADIQSFPETFSRAWRVGEIKA